MTEWLSTEALFGDGVKGIDEIAHAIICDGLFHQLPIGLVLQRAAGERPIHQVAQRDAAGGEMSRHVAQEEENLKSG